MKIEIQLAKEGQSSDCLSCIKHSDLWEAYFESNATAGNDLEEMISKKQIYLALNEENECIGFMGVIHNGCFHRFSYLALIAVASNHRGKGLGKKLIIKYEEMGFKQADRVFLLVSDFNVKAQLLYKKLGYKQVGNIPNLFKKGVSENLFVKYKMGRLG